MAKAEKEQRQQLLEALLDETNKQLWMSEIDERTLQRMNVKESGKYNNQLGALQATIDALSQKKGVLEEELKTLNV